MFDHPEIEFEIEPEFWHLCKICGSHFDSRFELDSHISSLHSVDLQYKKPRLDSEGNDLTNSLGSSQSDDLSAHLDNVLGLGSTDVADFLNTLPPIDMRDWLMSSNSESTDLLEMSDLTPVASYETVTTEEEDVEPLSFQPKNSVIHYHSTSQKSKSKRREESKEERKRVVRCKLEKVTKVKCNLCTKVVAPNYLKIHQRSHTNERPFACTICNETFTTKYFYMRHGRICNNDDD